MSDMNIIYNALLHFFRKEFTAQDILQYIKGKYDLGLRYHRVVHKVYPRITAYKERGVLSVVKVSKKENGRRYYTYRFAEDLYA
jgi:hypothetical protein